MTYLLVCIILLYGFFLDKIGLLFIPTSGQTDHKTKQETFLKRSFDGAAVDEGDVDFHLGRHRVCEEVSEGAFLQAASWPSAVDEVQRHSYAVVHLQQGLLLGSMVLHLGDECPKSVTFT